MAGPGTIGNTVLANEKDNDEVGRVLGVRKIFNLNYGNHMMDAISRSELRSRLIFLFRLLRIDTVICYDPWGHYEENPDHYVTADCVEAACWMAAGDKDYTEHFAAGLRPHAVSGKYYFARFQQRVNRVVDIGPTFERKIDVNLMNKAQGPAGETGAKLRADLAARKQRLPLLGDNDETANREYIKRFVLKGDVALCRAVPLYRAGAIRAGWLCEAKCRAAIRRSTPHQLQMHARHVSHIVTDPMAVRELDMLSRLLRVACRFIVKTDVQMSVE
jgi:hypothetical protein